MGKALYVQCTGCGHVYSYNGPTDEQLVSFYTNDASYTSIYTEKTTVMQRVEEVSIPKAKYVMETYEKTFGKKPKSILDVGAGGGHFVQACKMLGVNSLGIEVNNNAIKFCEDVFGFKLLPADFLKHKLSDSFVPDIITFWGVIEHVYNPMLYINKAAELLKDRKGGLIVSSVPNWHSMSTAIQRAFKHRIIRHIDPIIHVHMFTLNSILTTYLLNQVLPKACWFYGMDAYEIVTQLSNKNNNSEVSADSILESILQLQRVIDVAGFSDEIALTGLVEQSN